MKKIVIPWLAVILWVVVGLLVIMLTILFGRS